MFARSARYVLVSLCVIFVFYAGVSLFAKARTDDPDYLCCSSTEDCNGGKCCDPDSIGETMCSLEKVGICMMACVPHGGRR